MCRPILSRSGRARAENECCRARAFLRARDRRVDHVDLLLGEPVGDLARDPGLG
jgi:hypothetical protein